MRYAYAVLGIGFIAIIGAVVILARTSHAPASRVMHLTLTSPAFFEGQRIPARYTCDGDNINPPLVIEGVPDRAGSLSIIVEDPDIPEKIKAERGIEVFDHLVLYDIPHDTTEIPERMVNIGYYGQNSTGGTGYRGPCPPADLLPYEHRYIFTLYALDDTWMAMFETPPTKDDLLASFEEHILATTTLTGTYSRHP